MNENINFEAVTLEDCIDMYEKRGMVSVVSAGLVTGFAKEESTNE